MVDGKPIIGICGGIGSGKSTVARELARLGGLLISSDELNRQVLDTDEVINTLCNWWGPDLVGSDGRIDRGRLARIVFGDERKRKRLESLVHPLIAARRADIIRQRAGDRKVKAIILDSPLLFESSLARECDLIVFVEASEARRVERLRRSRGWNLRELRRRERWQMSLGEKRKRSDHVIRNEGTLDDLRAQVRDLFDRVVSERLA